MVTNNKLTVVCRTEKYSRIFSISGYWFTNKTCVFEYYINGSEEVAGTITIVGNDSLQIYLGNELIIELREYS